jgi:hypothetical protein
MPCMPSDPYLYRHCPILTGVGIMLLCQPAGSVAQLRLLDSISGEGLMAVQAALPELIRRGVTPEGYKITVWSIGRGEVSVLFEHADRTGVSSDGQRKPDVSVRVSQDQLPPIRPARTR